MDATMVEGGRAPLGSLILMLALLMLTTRSVRAQALFEDPEGRADPPATLESFTVPSHGERLIVRALVAAGPGPHPVLVLLHGFPGNESNFDLAHALRRIGWNVVVMHYRGSWGSGGLFTFHHVLEDVDALIEHLRSPDATARLRSDPDRLVLVGHSMGGFAALFTAAQRPDVSAAAALAGFNFGASAEHVERDPARREEVLQGFAGSLAPLRSPSAESLFQEYLDAGPEWDLRARAPDLSGRPILLVGGAMDRVAPPTVHHHPLREALEAAGHPRLTTAVLNDDHAFSSTRIALAALLESWLRDASP